MTLVQNRQPAGVPTGGQFASLDRTEATVDLTSAFDTIVVPTAEQKVRARVMAEIRGVLHGYSPQRIEGDGARIAQRLAEREAAFEAWKRGETHADDAAFADIWSGDAPGFSRHQVAAELARFQSQREQLELGELSPSSITGPVDGNARDEALRQINSSIECFELALESDGRSLSVNQEAVLEAKRARDGHVAPF